MRRESNHYLFVAYSVGRALSHALIAHHHAAPTLTNHKISARKGCGRLDLPVPYASVPRYPRAQVADHANREIASAGHIARTPVIDWYRRLNRSNRLSRLIDDSRFRVKVWRQIIKSFRLKHNDARGQFK